jgi:lysophospholipase L1-like esterase
MKPVRAFILVALTMNLAAAAQPTPVTPFVWEGDTVMGESVLFAQANGGEHPSATLLFPPQEIKRVVHTATHTAYEAGRDYTVEGNRITLPEGSRIPVTPIDVLRPPSDQAKYHHRDGKTGLLWSNGHVFHDMQVEVTYTRDANLWKERGASIPASAAKHLPHTMDLLGKGVLKLVVYGDSISAGGDSSGHSGVPPVQPAFPKLVEKGLEAHYNARVMLVNPSVAGWSTTNGIANIQDVVEVEPDLVILAFGMNDASGRRAPEEYIANLNTMMEAVRAVHPECEFLLVATMLGNPDWDKSAPDLYPLYRDALAELQGEGIGLADVTAVWTEVLKHKAYLDLTGNGLNHPNDFGHRLYAQVILAALR